MELCDTRICTLYSPRPVLEVVVVLRKISTQCHQVSQQVIAGAGLRYAQWVNKTLRSRQRHNYLRMLNRLAAGFALLCGWVYERMAARCCCCLSADSLGSLKLTVFTCCR